MLQPTPRFAHKLLFVIVVLGLVFHVDAATSAPAAAAGENKGLPLIKLQKSGKNSGKPLYIKSDTFHLDSESRIFTYQGRVEVLQDDLLITAATMTGRYDKNNKLETITCEKNVVITRGETLRANANRAFYRVAENTIELTEGPELINNGNALTADKVILYLDDDRSEAEGDVRVKLVEEAETAHGTSLKGLVKE